MESALNENETEIVDLWNIMFRVHNRIKRDIMINLREKGLRPIYLKILYTVHNSESIPLHQIAEENDVTPAWITNTVNKMERDGLIRKERNKDDHRYIKAIITESGKKILMEAMCTYTSSIKENLKVLSASQKRQLVRILNLMDSK
ncbi:MAG: MarR family transcriptional regulator [Candidatus Thermoplasmatota archaeon]|nr:MarR family transcriptional regulator [Candidatus Thermoplasmatota archaeon]